MKVSLTMNSADQLEIELPCTVYDKDKVGDQARVYQNIADPIGLLLFHPEGVISQNGTVIAIKNISFIAADGE